MTNWYAVYTQPMKEMIAAQNLIRQGFEPFLPRFRKTRRHARKIEEFLAPLFPRYLFVRMDPKQQRWRSINGTIGVSFLLCNGNDPIPVPESVISAIQEREEDGVIALDAPSFSEGQKIRVLDGPFAEMEGLFERSDEGRRVHLLLNL
ncbi:MAG: transcriptional activator RfaH, partial [Rhodospirillales bacterium]|nr:transcriptional activator RfaH [Rhodospirillales bacterium]MCW8970976.1 transcriptional activator RfaH [Rhodospirillales bacterium]